MDRYNPSEYAARADFPAGIVSYRTASDGGKGDRCGEDLVMQPRIRLPIRLPR